MSSWKAKFQYPETLLSTQKNGFPAGIQQILAMKCVIETKFY